MAEVRQRVDKPVPKGSGAARSKTTKSPTITSTAPFGTSGQGGGSSSAGRGKRSPATTMTTTWEQAQTWIKEAGKATTPPVGKTSTPVEVPKVGFPEGSSERINRNPLAYRVQWNGSQLQSPRRAPSTTLTAPSTGARFNKGTSARLIILAMGIAGVAIIFGGRNFKPYGSKVNGKIVMVPGTLHAFAGLTIAGTIALIVNEVSAELGIVFAAGLGFIALADAQAFATWGTKVFGGGSPTTTGGGAGGVAGSGETFDPSTGILHGSRGNFRLVPTGNGNYSIEPLNPTPTGPGQSGVGGSVSA